MALLSRSSSALSTLGSPTLPSMPRLLKMCCLVKRTLCSARERLTACLKIKNFLPHSFHQGLFQKKESAGLAEAEQVPRCSPEPDKVDERSVTRPRQEPGLHRLAAQSTRGSLVGEGSLFGSNNFPCINSQASRFCL